LAHDNVGGTPERVPNKSSVGLNRFVLELICPMDNGIVFENSTNAEMNVVEK
jgi:hypothetical protein